MQSLRADAENIVIFFLSSAVSTEEYCHVHRKIIPIFVYAWFHVAPSRFGELFSRPYGSLRTLRLEKIRTQLTNPRPGSTLGGKL
jgi:hypothetical protein